MSQKITVWQCRDFCCEDRSYSDRWWNARLQGRGSYKSAPDPKSAYFKARATR